MERDVQDVDHTTRHRADIHLPTGKVVTLTSDWKQSHWEEVDRRKSALIAEAKARAEQIRTTYGIECTDIRVYEERRRTERVVETTTTTTLHSTHHLPKGS